MGASRSGTPSFAGALSKLGVSFGEPQDLYVADNFNAAGYFELKWFNAALTVFHMSLNLAGLALDPTPDDWRERPPTSNSQRPPP